MHVTLLIGKVIVSMSTHRNKLINKRSNLKENFFQPILTTRHSTDLSSPSRATASTTSSAVERSRCTLIMSRTKLALKRNILRLTRTPNYLQDRAFSLRNNLFAWNCLVIYPAIENVTNWWLLQIAFKNDVYKLEGKQVSLNGDDVFAPLHKVYKDGSVLKIQDVG